jgi:hypothetical protein
MIAGKHHGGARHRCTGTGVGRFPGIAGRLDACQSVLWMSR